jgi:hypothetical protein
VWARVHKIDRVKPQAKGAIVLVEDERNAGAMARVPPLSILVAIARVLDARRLLEAKYNGTGEVRYAAAATPPPFLSEAIARAGATVSDRTGERVISPANPAGVSSVIDTAFADLAYHTRTSMQAADLPSALRVLEDRVRKAPLDRDQSPAAYWTAVLELSALAGELSRARGGRWIETKEVPIPFAIKFPEGGLASPAKLAQQIVAGSAPIESMATDVTT